MFRRFSLFHFSAAIVTAILLVSFYATESDILHRIRFSFRQELIKNDSAPSTFEDVPLSTIRHIDAHKVIHDPNAHPIGPVKPATTLLGLPVHLPPVNKTTTSTAKAVLVISTVAEDDLSWIHGELGDLLQPSGGFSTHLYVNDNLTAPLHPPANKGHEATAYLTYIIDNYHELPPVSIFLHGHREAWHNNVLLDMSTPDLIRSLLLDKVEQDGYFNLRCHWNPGCPEHLYPNSTEYNHDKEEEPLVKDAFMQVFGVEEDQVPRVLAQACCSQFAVTADRIRSLPREKYIHFRNWLLESKLTDYITGRVFEYFWQYMFNGTPVFCPDPRICYCEGYGICFENPEDYDSWMTTSIRLWRLGAQLEAWKQWWEPSKAPEKRALGSVGVETDDWDRTTPRVDLYRHEPGVKQRPELEPSTSYQRFHRKQKAVIGDPIYRPPQRRGAWLRREIDELQAELDMKKQQAQRLGKDAAGRLAAVEAVRTLGPPEMEKPKHGLLWQVKRDADL